MLTGTTLSVVDLRKKSTSILERNLQFRGIPYGWSPDGRRLAYSRKRASPELVLYDIDSRATEVIWNADRFGFYDFPSWTPDGTWMIFSVNPGGTMYFQQTYQALNLQTGENVQLFADGGGLHLSPDGRQIQLTRQSPGKLGGWLATLEFGEPPSPTP
jgi:Tol biopolymer transport system component